MRVPDLAQPPGGAVERLVPAGLTEDVVPVVWIDREILVLGNPRPANERHTQPVPVLDVIESVAALDAEPADVRRAVAARHEENAVRLDVVGELAPDAAVRAHRRDL